MKQGRQGNPAFFVKLQLIEPGLVTKSVFALFLAFVAALFRPAAAGAFVSAPDANAQACVGAFELVAATLVGPASAATYGLHEGIGVAYDENASDYRFAARGGLGEGAAP